MADDIGSIKSVNGTSISLNGAPGQGTQKPVASMKTNVGGTAPPKPADGPVSMPK